MKRTSLLLATLLISLAPVPAQNLLLNGSFESGGTFQANSLWADRMLLGNGSTVIANWTVGRSTTGLFWWIQAPSYNAQDGSRFIDLDSNMQTPFTYIEQSFATTIGKQYLVSANFSSEGNGGPATTSVLINGSLLGSATAGAGSGEASDYWTDLVWTQHSFLFTATATVSTLRFQDATTDNGWNPLVDNASVTVIPEPSALGILLFALVGIQLSNLRSRGLRDC